MTETLRYKSKIAHMLRSLFGWPNVPKYTRNTYYSPDAAIKGWRIPKFLDSWKTAFGPKLFQMLINWRIAAHKKASQEQLNEDFATSMEEYTARHSKRKARHAQQPSSEPEGQATKQTTVTQHIDLEDSDNNYDVHVKKPSTYGMMCLAMACTPAAQWSFPSWCIPVDPNFRQQLRPDAGDIHLEYHILYRKIYYNEWGVCRLWSQPAPSCGFCCSQGD